MTREFCLGHNQVETLHCNNCIYKKEGNPILKQKDSDKLSVLKAKGKYVALQRPLVLFGSPINFNHEKTKIRTNKKTIFSR